jgi:microcin C transport system substrate-binding protein
MNHRGLWRALAAAGLFLALGSPAGADSPVHVTHAIAMNGEPKYGPDFKHLDYVNPDAPKGGIVRFAAIGSFDTFNPFTLKGTVAAGAGAPFETLLVSTADEAFSEYGLIAESIEMPEDPPGSSSRCGPRRAGTTAPRSRPRTSSSASTS